MNFDIYFGEFRGSKLEPTAFNQGRWHPEPLTNLKTVFWRIMHDWKHMEIRDPKRSLYIYIYTLNLARQVPKKPFRALSASSGMECLNTYLVFQRYVYTSSKAANSRPKPGSSNGVRSKLSIAGGRGSGGVEKPLAVLVSSPYRSTNFLPKGTGYSLRCRSKAMGQENSSLYHII